MSTSSVFTGGLVCVLKCFGVVVDQSLDTKSKCMHVFCLLCVGRKTSSQNVGRPTLLRIELTDLPPRSSSITLCSQYVPVKRGTVTPFHCYSLDEKKVLGNVALPTGR